ncbi:MAG TPA: hypothetical protein VFO10_18480 [Oligoflexus sp.]|uniref:plasmid mobilization protein n=1 Tax=Oligoflexus sp. TaxID=1971216 RepID=UPI002D80F8B8|nr:hypothetical protein [Oligoflexus sp.]HET9239253.1 hypothetical protein [Oligoflexus sp.]
MLDKVINVRVTEEEKRDLILQAEVAGTSLSSLVRKRSLHRPILAATDLQMIRELRRLGGLLKHLHASPSLDPDASSLLLQAIRRKIEEIGQ